MRHDNDSTHHSRRNREASRSNFVFLFATVILSGLISTMISLMIDRAILTAPRLVTVDVPGLMIAFAKSEAKRTDSLAQQRADVHRFGQQLERVLKDIAEKEHRIIIPQKAVIAGGQDITSAVMARLTSPSVEGIFSSLEASDDLESR